MINFVAALVIGVVVGLIGGFVLKGKQPNAIWLAPVLAVVGALVASVLAYFFGEPTYGWKEPILQVVLAVAGVAAARFVGGESKGAPAPASD